MSGFGLALRSEIFVGLRLRWTAFLLLAPPLAAAAAVVLGSIGAEGARARSALLGNGAPAASGANGYGLLVDGLSAGFTVAHLAFAAAAAHALAAERERGTIRHLLIRRSSRLDCVLAKGAWLCLLEAAALALAGAAAWGAAALLADLGPVVEDGVELIGVAEIRSEILRGVGLAVAPLPAALALGLLVSAAARSPAAAVAAVLGVTLAFDLFKGGLGRAARYVWAFHCPSIIDGSYLKDVGRLVRGFSDVYVEDGTFLLNLVVPWPAAALFIALAILIAGRREM